MATKTKSSMTRDPMIKTRGWKSQQRYWNSNKKSFLTRRIDLQLAKATNRSSAR